jgi:hypothetical protein
VGLIERSLARRAVQGVVYAGRLDMLHELKASWCGFDLALGLRLAVLGSCGECDIVWGFGFVCGASWIGMGL